MDGLIEMLAGWCDRLPTDITDKPKSLDLGCGEGTFGAALFKSAPEDFCGIDLSRRAILLARKKMPTATWILSNADRRIPAASGSVHRILSLFGRRPIGEMHRILAQRGLCIVAVPGTNDLIELREEVQQSGHQRDRTKAIIAEFSEAGFEIQDHASWTHQATLDKSAIADALAMTYRGVRNSQQQRVDGLNSLIVTLQADLLLFQHA
jgi:23S rRNA (guanine745-N1)-methyltransferase